jgi:hypothetical protein
MTPKRTKINEKHDPYLQIFINKNVIETGYKIAIPTNE